MSLNSYIAGIDIGTTNIKGSLFSSKGELISTASIDYPSFTPQEGFHEQNPDDWVNGFINVLSELLVSDDISQNLKAIGISTQGGTLVPVDRNFNPLYNAITWLDRRGSQILNEYNFLKEKNIEVYLKTGWRLDSGLSFLALWWLKENKKEIFNKIYKVLYVNDYFLKKITGNNIQDPSNASITLFYNVKETKWDDVLLSFFNFKSNKLSEVKNPGVFVGYLNDECLKRLKIKADSKIKVFNGSHDQYCVGLGNGIFSEDEILLATGTAWVIFQMLNKPILDDKKFFAVGRFTFAQNFIQNFGNNLEPIQDINFEDKFGMIYTIPTGGASVRWFANNILNLKNEKQLFDIISSNSEYLLTLKNNVIFHPYLNGAWGPDFDISRKASFSNLELSHNYLDLIKALLEGVGFQLRKIFNVLTEKGIKPSSIKMVGGGSRDKIWPQIIADINKKEIFIPEDPKLDFATRGAAILAGFGAGVFNSFEEGYERLKVNYKSVKPNHQNLSFYDEKFKLF